MHRDEGAAEGVDVQVAMGGVREIQLVKVVGEGEATLEGSAKEVLNHMILTKL